MATEAAPLLPLAGGWGGGKGAAGKNGAGRSAGAPGVKLWNSPVLRNQVNFKKKYPDLPTVDDTGSRAEGQIRQAWTRTAHAKQKVGSTRGRRRARESQHKHTKHDRSHFNAHPLQRSPFNAPRGRTAAPSPARIVPAILWADSPEGARNRFVGQHYKAE